MQPQAVPESPRSYSSPTIIIICVLVYFIIGWVYLAKYDNFISECKNIWKYNLVSVIIGGIYLCIQLVIILLKSDLGYMVTLIMSCISGFAMSIWAIVIAASIDDPCEQKYLDYGSGLYNFYKVSYLFFGGFALGFIILIVLVIFIFGPRLKTIVMRRLGLIPRTRNTTVSVPSVPSVPSMPAVPSMPSVPSMPNEQITVHQSPPTVDQPPPTEEIVSVLPLGPKNDPDEPKTVSLTVFTD